MLEFFAVIVGLVSMYGTQQGISSLNPDPLLSWGGAIGLNGLVTAYWIVLMRSYPKGNDSERKSYIIQMITLGVVAFFASTQFTIVTFGGRDAIRTHHEETIHAADAQALKLYRRQAAIANSATQFDGLAKQFDRLATEETGKGTMTGMTGAGSVVNTLRNVQGLLENMSRTSDSTNKGYEKLYAQYKEESGKTRAIISNIERIPLDDLDKLRDLNLQFGAELATINELTARMAETSSAGYLKATIDSIGELTKISHSTDRPEQKAALEAIAPVVDSTQKVLLQITQTSGSAQEVEVQTFRTISPMSAIYKYWREISWAFAFGIALDFSSMLSLFILKTGRRVEVEEEEKREEQLQPRRRLDKIG